MNTTTFTANSTITAQEACGAVHAKAGDLFKQLGGETRYTDGTGPVTYPAFQDSAEDALLVALLNLTPADFDAEDEDNEVELLCEQSIAVNVDRRLDGRLMYEVVFASDGSDYGTVCQVKDLLTLEDWFDEEWISEAQAPERIYTDNVPATMTY